MNGSPQTPSATASNQQPIDARRYRQAINEQNFPEGHQPQCAELPPIRGESRGAETTAAAGRPQAAA
jgi:hypothetical protein